MKTIIISAIVGLSIVTRVVAPATAYDPGIKQFDQDTRDDQNT